jgi:hypothetical protein
MLSDNLLIQCSVSGISFKVGETVNFIAISNGVEILIEAEVKRSFNTIYLTDEHGNELKRANLTLNKTVPLGLIPNKRNIQKSAQNYNHNTI